MNFSERWRHLIYGLRAFVLGQGVVDPSDRYFGHYSEQSAPAEYGDYIASSNGVYACATLRAELLASLPLRLYRGVDKQRREVEQGELRELLDRVNPFWTFNRLVSMTELSLCLWGKAFWFVERGANGKGKPRELWWARPDRVRVVPHPENYIDHFLYMPANGAQPMPFTPAETIWLRYANPLDEFEGLSPLGAARLAADYASAAMQSNHNLFANGIQLGGIVAPKTGGQFTDDQATQLENALARRFKGVDKAHRWGVLRFDAQINPIGLSPRDAEFTKGLAWALEDICRAYKVPLDLVGGQRTYENVDAALKAIWTFAIIPESRFIATELNEQLLPMLPDADACEFDVSGVSVLQQSQNELWQREREQIELSAITINEWRETQGKKPVTWGDAPLKAGAPTPAPAEGDGVDDVEFAPTDEERSARSADTLAYGESEHVRLWERFARRTETQEARFGLVVAELLRRQRDSIIAKLTKRGKREGDLADEPFNMAEWIKRFRTEARPELEKIVNEAGQSALDDYAIAISFDVLEPMVLRFIEQRAQRFAREVNQTTWRDLKSSLAQGVEDGESIEQLAERVKNIMGARIRSSAETIARTEVIGASNGGTLLAWQQSDVVEQKVWLAAIDARTRDTHTSTHGQTVDINEDFIVGRGRGKHPGAIGLAEEDINCRCTMTAKLKQARIMDQLQMEADHA